MKFTLPTVPFTVPTSPQSGCGLIGPGPQSCRARTVHEYVYHCHILEHEEHDMMRPLGGHIDT